MASATQSFFSVRGSLDGCDVLLTGATGFLGSLVLEQLLRTAPGVRDIFVLSRGKRGVSAAARIRRLLHSGLFHLVRDRPELLDKVVLLEGDLAGEPVVRGPRGPPSDQAPAGPPHAAVPIPTEEHEGEDAEEEGVEVEIEAGGGSGSANGAAAPLATPLQPMGARANGAAQHHSWDPLGKNVRVGSLQDLRRPGGQKLLVIHCAARIALEDPLRVTLEHNYLGTRRLLELVRGLPGVQGVVHVSSAFSNSSRPFMPEGTVHERVYPLSFEPQGLQEVDHAALVEQVMALQDADQAQARAMYLCHLFGMPNNYVLGKRLTELMVRDAHRESGVPIAIVRPSLVTSLAGRPYPGYVGNLAGPGGAAVAMALGLFAAHTIELSPFNHLDAVPGDVASSVIIAAGAALLARVSVAPPADADGPLVLHAASSCVNPFSHLEAYVMGKRFFDEHPPIVRLGRNMPPDPEYEPVRWKGAIAKRWQALKVRAACALLGCFGKDGAARSLRAGHRQMQMQLHSPKNNTRLFFSVTNVVALERLLPPDERQDFPLVWRGSWHALVSASMAAVMRFYLKQPLADEALHNFTHIPSRRVAMAP